MRRPAPAGGQHGWNAMSPQLTDEPATQEACERLLALFAREGYRRVEPPVLQPAEVFLDLSGEDIRRRLFVTASGDGAELCLRPEYTIPVTRMLLAGHDGGPLRAAVSYLGPVFRLRAGETGEFPQAGVESFGREDTGAADAEILSLAMEAAAALGLRDPVVRLGDMGLLNAVVTALGADAPTRRRLLRGVAAGQPLAALAGNGDGDGDYAGLLDALAGQDPRAAQAFVEDVLAIAGISRVGGRSASDIARRFLARAERRAAAFGDEKRAVLERYLAIAGDPDDAVTELRRLAADAGLDIGAAVDLFEERLGFFAARDMAVERIRFSARFARNLDYYSGFIFEIDDPARPDRRPVAAGGRYDGLAERLGAAAPVPAVGCALWLDRFDSLTLTA